MDPFTNDRDDAFMTLALEEARAAAAIGEVPIGAVVVYYPPASDVATRALVASAADPMLLARAHNLRETTRNPAGHAEFLALQEAARALGSWRLTGCTVYVTLEPCPMCAGLMQQARVDRCVWGAPDPKAGALGTLYRLHDDERLNHQFSVTGGVRRDECATVIRRFFSDKRTKGAP